MLLKVFVDESGDLGWNFDSPFREGGSSRYLTIAYLILPDNKNKFPKRIVKKLYKKFKIKTSNEKKGSELGTDQRKFLTEQVINLVKREKDIIIGTITVKKKNVEEHIRKDSNKLYNYMMNLVIVPKIINAKEARIIVDRRSIKVKSGNSCIDYLQTQIWFEHKSKTILRDIPEESHKNLSLLFIDWIANTIWRYYENKEMENFNKLKDVIEVRELYYG